MMRSYNWFSKAFFRDNVGIILTNGHSYKSQNRIKTKGDRTVQRWIVGSQTKDGEFVLSGRMQTSLRL